MWTEEDSTVVVCGNGNTSFWVVAGKRSMDLDGVSSSIFFSSSSSSVNLLPLLRVPGRVDPRLI